MIYPIKPVSILMYNEENQDPDILTEICVDRRLRVLTIISEYLSVAG